MSILLKMHIRLSALANLFFPVNFYFTVVGKLRVSMTCKAVLAQEFVFPDRDTPASKVCQQRSDKMF